MRFQRLSPLALLVTAQALACEPADEGRPPATAHDVAASTDVSATAPAGAAPAGEPPAADGTQYASAEYMIGEDTDSYDDNDPAALKDFHETLTPYGSWVD